VLLDKYACDLVSHVPGRRRRVRMAGVAEGSWWTARSTRSRSRGGHMQAHPTRRQAQKGCRRAQSFWDMESQNVLRARRHSLTPAVRRSARASSSPVTTSTPGRDLQEIAAVIEAERKGWE
jgi:hypothetical protein